MKKTLLPALFVAFSFLVLPACSSDDEDNTPVNETGNTEESLSASITFEQTANGNTVEREGTANVILTESDGIRGYTITGFEYTAGGAIKYSLEFAKAFEGNEFKQPKTGSFDAANASGNLTENAFQITFDDNEAGITYGDSAATGSITITENGEKFLQGDFELTLISRETGNAAELKNGKIIAVKDSGFSSL